MLIERKSFKDIDRAAYNPRVELRPGDDEYTELEKSLHQFGCVVPLVWNRRTNRVVGGHQRMTVMENNGITEADFSVVDLDEIREKELNIALNKTEGAWDDTKLAELLDNLGDKAIETGFSLPEIEALQSSIEDALDDDFLDDELAAIEETFNVSLDFPIEIKEELNAYIKANGKDSLVQLMIAEVRKEE